MYMNLPAISFKVYFKNMIANSTNNPMNTVILDISYTTRFLMNLQTYLQSGALGLKLFKIRISIS